MNSPTVPNVRNCQPNINKLQGSTSSEKMSDINDLFVPDFNHATLPSLSSTTLFREEVSSRIRSVSNGVPSLMCYHTGQKKSNPHCTNRSNPAQKRKEVDVKKFKNLFFRTES